MRQIICRKLSCRTVFITLVLIFLVLVSTKILEVSSFGSSWELYNRHQVANNNSSVILQSQLPLVFNYKKSDPVRLKQVDKNDSNVNTNNLAKRKKVRIRIPRLTSEDRRYKSLRKYYKYKQALDNNTAKDASLWPKISNFIQQVLPKIIKYDANGNIDNAMGYLDNLKDTLIRQYGNKEKLGRDGIGFPSIEGALLSLAFLTFAVSLIDFIQNLLSRLRFPNQTTTTTTAPALFSGRGFSEDQPNIYEEHNFLNSLTKIVFSAIESDNKWQCRRRMLCEANQRAAEYGVVQGVLMYFLSLGVSFLLQNQRVSESLEAMKFGRRGSDCTQLYSCPFSL